MNVVHVQCRFSIAERYRTSKMLWTVALAMAWLLFQVAPLAGQDPGEMAGTPGADGTASLGTEDYMGPAILSRGNQAALGGSQYATIQPFLSVNRVYGTGLGGSYVNAGSGLQSGVDLGYGLKGTHRWKRTTLTIDYNGSYRDYTGATTGNGLNQFLAATAVSQLTRHLVLSIRQAGGILKQDIGGLLLQPAFLENSSTLPTNEPFSNGMKLIDSVATLTYQKTRRLSFSGSIAGSLVRQDSPLLVGTNSSIVSGDLGYRLSSRSTIGIDYSFSHFGYTTFGSGDVQSAGVDYSWRATRTLDLALQAGIAHASTVGLAVVPIDPALAALLGDSAAIQASYRTINAPSINARITKRWRRASVNMSYLEGISPGNGLVLTSKQESLTAGLQYSNAKRWTVSIQAGRTTMDQLATAGSYSGNTFAASFSHLVRPGIQAVARFSVQPVNYIGEGGLDRTYYRGDIGFIFTPSARPIALR